VTEGQVGDRFYVIQRGQVDVLVADPAGRPRHLATLRAGDYFGEVALLYEVPRTATIRTRTPVELASLRKEHFTALLAAAPDVRKVLDQQLRGRQCQGVTGGR
jgi:ATP-binding cassette subfamily B protein